MTAQKGSDFLLEVEDSPGSASYTVIGGFRSNNFSINNETIDITNKDSAGVRTLLDGGGIQSISTGGSGVFMDDAAFAIAESAARNRTTLNWRVVLPSYGTYVGAFQLTSLEFGGEHNGEATYTISLESAGPVAFATI